MTSESYAALRESYRRVSRIIQAADEAAAWRRFKLLTLPFLGALLLLAVAAILLE